MATNTTPQGAEPREDGWIDPVIRDAQARSLIAFNISRLIEAAETLADACEKADAAEELAEEIDGSMIDAVNQSIRDLRGAQGLLPAAPAAPTNGGEEPVTHRQAADYASVGTDLMTAMLRDVDERLNRDAPDIPGARVALHGARLGAAYAALQPQPTQQGGAEVSEAMVERLCTAMQDGIGCTPWESRTWDRDDGVSRGLVRDSVRRILASLKTEKA